MESINIANILRNINDDFKKLIYECAPYLSNPSLELLCKICEDYWLEIIYPATALHDPITLENMYTIKIINKHAPDSKAEYMPVKIDPRLTHKEKAIWLEDKIIKIAHFCGKGAPLTSSSSLVVSGTGLYKTSINTTPIQPVSSNIDSILISEILSEINRRGDYEIDIPKFVDVLFKLGVIKSKEEIKDDNI